MQRLVSAMMSIILVSLTACVADDTSESAQDEQGQWQANDFNSIADYTDNSLIEAALAQCEMTVEEGFSPPDVSGKYQIAATVIETTVPGLQIGAQILSTFCFHSQTEDGKIAYAEDAQGITFVGQGSFISGTGSRFTIFGTVDIDMGIFSEDMEDCVQSNANLITGELLQDGDLSISVLTVTVGTEGCPAGFDSLVGVWQRVDGTATLIGACKGAGDV